MNSSNYEVLEKRISKESPKNNPIQSNMITMIAIERKQTSSFLF